MTNQITIVRFDYADMRDVTHNMKRLKSVQKTYSLKEGQAVLLSNFKQDRFRMVAIVGGIPMLILIPTGKTRQARLLIYQLVVAWLLKTTVTLEVAEQIKELEQEAA